MKYTLLTGATSDIGNSIAVLLSLDYNLLLIGRDLDKLYQLKLKCNNSARHKILVLDFNDLKGLRVELSDFMKSESIVVDNIIHCAGMMKVMHMRSVDINNTSQIFNVNLFSIIEIISTLLNKRVNDCQIKCIVFISAILARYGSTGHHLYSSTKAALDGLMRSLAVELSPKTRVNSVLPGAVRTQMSKELLSNEELSNKLNNDYLLGIGEPKDISTVIRFLVSSDSAWITGQEIIVDGGRTINIKNK
jgi:NAD(P)-dependent dehydrogenase (short-subunit alcohol dehydrogenase family)